MTQQAHPLVRGCLVEFSIRKVFDRGIARFDVEIVLSDEWKEAAPKTTIRFSDARDVRYGSAHAGMDFGANVCLSIDDVSSDGWDGVRFKVRDIEDFSGFSLYCRAFAIEALGTAEPIADGQ